VITRSLDANPGSVSELLAFARTIADDREREPTERSNRGFMGATAVVLPESGQHG
jgi:hypothetical protein